MRSDGVLRVILNVWVQKGMPMQVRNEKYLEFCASEGGGLLKFLCKGKSGDVERFGEALKGVVPSI